VCVCVFWEQNWDWLEYLSSLPLSAQNLIFPPPHQTRCLCLGLRKGCKLINFLPLTSFPPPFSHSSPSRSEGRVESAWRLFDLTGRMCLQGERSCTEMSFSAQEDEIGDVSACWWEIEEAEREITLSIPLSVNHLS